MRSILFLANIVVLAVVSCGAAEKIVFAADDAAFAYAEAGGLVSNCSPRVAGTIRGRLAANWILNRVSCTGVDAEVDSFTAAAPGGEKRFHNVYVEFPGTKKDAPWIVLMSHFDTTPRVPDAFQGANDGASTTGLLIALARAIRRAGPQPDNILLAWTDAEECVHDYGPNDGFQGSRRVVARLQERKRKVKVAFCLDMLGDRDLHIVLPQNTTPVLKKIVPLVAARAGLEGLVSLDDDTRVKDDHQPFLDAGWSAAALIDFSFGPNNAWWHSPNDTLDKISADSLGRSGLLVVSLLNALGRH